MKAHSPVDRHNNPRVIAVARNDPRGDILSADGIVLASSVPSKTGYYKYQRVYNPYTALLFSQIVGFDSIIYGKTGVEAEYDSYLQSHTQPAKTLRDLLRSRTTTGNVTLTISSTLQSRWPPPSRPPTSTAAHRRPGPWCSTSRPARSRPCSAIPTYDPTPLASPNITDGEVRLGRVLNQDPASARWCRAPSRRGFLPGSTFKTVTSAAVYDHQPALAKLDIPVAQCITLRRSRTSRCATTATSGTGRRGVRRRPGRHPPASCDTAFATLGMDLGGPALTAEAQAFGFNQVIPDRPSRGRSPRRFPAGRDSSTSTSRPRPTRPSASRTSVATALQMALVAAGIANRGVIMTPHVMRDIHDSAGNLVATYQPKPWLTATNPLTAAAVTSLMQAVVTRRDGHPGRLPGGVERGGQDRNGRDRSDRPTSPTTG